MPDLKKLLLLLLEHEIDFILVGGFACTTYGSSLITQDLDICMELNEEQLTKLRHALKDIKPIHRMNPNFQPSFLEHPESADGLKNLYLKTDLGTLDILSEISAAGTFQDLKKNANTVSLYDHPCAIISLIDLIDSKSAMTRPKDAEAVKQLKIIQAKSNNKP